MSEAVFPTLPGIDIATKRSFVFATKRQETDSGKVLRVRRWPAPKYRYTIAINFLRASENEIASLFALIAEVGNWDTFWFTDPYDSVQRRVELDMGEFEVEQIVSGAWKAPVLRMLSVL